MIVHRLSSWPILMSSMLTMLLSLTLTGWSFRRLSLLMLVPYSVKLVLSSFILSIVHAIPGTMFKAIATFSASSKWNVPGNVQTALSESNLDEHVKLVNANIDPPSCAENAVKTCLSAHMALCVLIAQERGIAFPSVCELLVPVNIKNLKCNDDDSLHYKCSNLQSTACPATKFYDMA